MTNRIETISKLRMAQVSSCSCLTKTPDADWHKEDCLYRVLTEAIAAVAVSHDLLESAQALSEAWAKFIDSFDYVPGIGDRAEDIEFREMARLRMAIAKALA